MSEATRITVMLTGLTLIFTGILTMLGFLVFSILPAPFNSFNVLFYAAPAVNAVSLLIYGGNYVDITFAIAFLIGGLVLILEGVKH